MDRGVTKDVEIALITRRNNNALLTHLRRYGSCRVIAGLWKCLDIVHVVNEVSKVGV